MSYFQYVQEYEDELRQILSANIRAARKSRRLTQTQLALHADLSLSYMTDIERCKTWVSDKTLAKIARALGMSPWELLRPGVEKESAKVSGKTERSEAVWQGIRELKRQILARFNKAVAETLRSTGTRRRNPRPGDFFENPNTQGALPFTEPLVRRTRLRAPPCRRRVIDNFPGFEVSFDK